MPDVTVDNLEPTDFTQRAQSVELQTAIKQQIHDHLSGSGVFTDLKKIVSTVLGGGGDAAIDAAGQSAVLSQMLIRAARMGPPPDPSRSHLHVTLLGGRAFSDDSVSGASEAPAFTTGGLPHTGGTLCACLAFGPQRFRSAPVPLCAEPKLSGSFLVELPRPEQLAAAEPSRALELLAVEEMLHLLVVEQVPAGGQRLVSSLLVDWRKVLHVGSCILSLQLPGVGEASKLPAGVVELRLELRPFLPLGDRLSEADLILEIKRQRTRQTEQERKFIAYSKAWWADYLAARPSHRERNVQLFALSELGLRRPITCYVRPLLADRLLDSPLHAAHFVSLIDFERTDTLGAAAPEIWQTNHATLAVRHGDAEEHAVLLCSLLLGFGLDAYVCLGTDHARGSHVWVMTVADGVVTFWESLTGQRFRVGGDALPFATLSCVFSDRALYANTQPQTEIASISLDLSSPYLWKPMDPAVLQSLTPVPQTSLLPPAITDRAVAEEAMEVELRAAIEAHRKSLGLQCEWDSRVAYCLAPALVSCASRPTAFPSTSLSPNPTTSLSLNLATAARSVGGRSTDQATEPGCSPCG